MTWREDKPDKNTPYGDAPSILSARRVDISSGLEKHFYWSDSTQSAGIARHSDFTSSARAFYATESALSSSNASGGAFFHATDSLLLYHIDASGNTIRAGGRTVIVVQGTPTSERYPSVRKGVFGPESEGGNPIRIAFSPAFGLTSTLIPKLTIETLLGTPAFQFLVNVEAIDSSGLTVNLYNISGQPENECNIHWHVEGFD